MSDDSTHDPLVDPAAVDRLREWGGDKLVREMIRLYLENVEVRLGQIDEGLSDEGTLATAEQGSHSLKSSAANVGATRVNRLAAEMEGRASSGDADGTRALREPLGAALDEARTALESLVQELPE